MFTAFSVCIIFFVQQKADKLLKALKEHYEQQKGILTQNVRSHFYCATSVLITCLGATCPQRYPCLDNAMDMNALSQHGGGIPSR